MEAVGTYQKIPSKISGVDINIFETLVCITTINEKLN